MSSKDVIRSLKNQYLEGGGEMGKLTRNYDWAGSSLGNPDGWSQSLLTTLSIILNSKFPMFLWWGPELIQFYNDAYRPSLGNDGKHPVALGQRAEECWPEIWEIIKPLIDRVMQDGEAVYSENQLVPIYRNNHIEDVYWTFSYSKVVDESGKPAGVLVVCSETTEQVTARQKIEAALADLEASESRFRFLVDQAPVAIALLTGRNLVIESANAMILKVWGKSTAILGEELATALPELQTQPFLQILDDVYTSGNAYYGNEAKATLEHGGRLEDSYFNFIYQPLRYQTGRSSILVIANDVTEQVLARRTIQEAEERLRLSIEGTEAGIWDLDLPTQTIIHSPRIAEIFGFPTGEKLSVRQLVDAIHPEDLPIARDMAFERALSTGMYYYEARIIWPDQSIHWIRNHGKLIFNDQGEPARLLGTIIDITRQQQVIEDLKASEEHLRLAKDAAELGTFDMDLMRGTMKWDRRCRELFGIYHQDPVSYEKDFLPGLHEEDRERIGKIIDDLFVKSISNGDYDVEYRTVGATDRKLRWVRAKGKVFFNERDEAVRFIGSVYETTDKKLDDQRKNDFIGMVSHELKTPLTSLKAYVQILGSKAREEEDEFSSNALDRAEKQVNKMSNMINGFLNISRLESGKIHLKMQDFDLGALAKDAIQEINTFNSSHTISFLPSGPIPVLGDRDKIEHVISNFLTNAIKYSPNNTSIWVRCAVAGKMAELSVRDEGMGIEGQDKERLFERYYRVASNDTQRIAGFGIGLYLSAEIIQRHNGKIWVESENGRGSTFYFTLPLSEG